MLIVIIHKPDKQTGMLTRLSNKPLKLEYNAGLNKLVDELWKAATGKCSFALNTHSEVRNKP